MSKDINLINPHILTCNCLNKANCPPPATDYGLRCVKWHEIELITWGEGEIITEGKSIQTHKGDLFFRSPGMKVRGMSPYYCYIIIFDMIYNPLKQDAYTEPEYYNSNCVFDESLININSADYNGIDFPHVLETTRYIKFLQLFEEIYNEWLFQKKNTSIHIKSLLLQILANAYKEYSHEGGTIIQSRSIQTNRPRIAFVREYIDANPGKWFSLEELANLAGLSRNFFCRIFRDIVGETPVEYINRQKINTAKKLLIETNSSMKTIALELGFINDTYFYILFKSRTGLTPTEYRQKHRSAYQGLQMLP